MTDTTPSPPDILTRLREHARSLILFGISPEPQLLLDAAAEIERLRQYRLNMEEAHGERLYHVDHLLEHFDSNGKLNGNGEWRLREIWKVCKGFDEASERAAKLFDVKGP